MEASFSSIHHENLIGFSRGKTHSRVGSILVCATKTEYKQLGNL
jgi:hypothetical protein